MSSVSHVMWVIAYRIHFSQIAVQQCWWLLPFLLELCLLLQLDLRISKRLQHSQLLLPWVFLWTCGSFVFCHLHQDPSFDMLHIHISDCIKFLFLGGVVLLQEFNFLVLLVDGGHRQTHDLLVHLPQVLLL